MKGNSTRIVEEVFNAIHVRKVVLNAVMCATQLYMTDNVRTHVRHVTNHLSTHLILKSIFLCIPENVHTRVTHATRPLIKLVFLKDICVSIQEIKESHYFPTGVQGMEPEQESASPRVIS